MMSLEDIRKALQDRRLLKVAEATGLHYNTLRMVRDKADLNPTHRVMKALSDYLEAK